MAGCGKAQDLTATQRSSRAAVSSPSGDWSPKAVSGALVPVFSAHRATHGRCLDSTCPGNTVLGAKEDTEIAPEGKVCAATKQW